MISAAENNNIKLSCGTKKLTRQSIDSLISTQTGLELTKPRTDPFEVAPSACHIPKRGRKKDVLLTARGLRANYKEIDPLGSVTGAMKSSGWIFTGKSEKKQSAPPERAPNLLFTAKGAAAVSTALQKKKPGISRSYQLPQFRKCEFNF